MALPLEIPQFRDAASSHPLLIRAANRAGRLIPGARVLSADAVWASAQKADASGQDPTPEARHALEVLVRSLSENVRLTPIGWFSARDDTERLARTHLRVHHAIEAIPDEERPPLPPPIFIIGWPRTGTTYLHQLLARDPANRTLPYWESFDPVPPTDGRPDRRIQKLGEMLKLLERIEPRYHAIHPMAAESPEECVALFMNEFRSLQFDFQYRVPEYVDWLLGEDADIAYRLYRRQLEFVHFHRRVGQRQILKDPTHLVHLETVIEHFPEAKFVFTHRDPAFSISSICSLMSYTRALFTDDVDPVAIGAEVMGGHWPNALERGRRLRRKLPSDRAVDVRHVDLARDPVATVDAIYHALGVEFTPEARTSMESFVRETTHDTRHLHAPEGFGLTAEGIRDRFSEYCSDLGL